MINGPVVFLILLAAIGWFGKNTSLIMAAGFLLSMKLIGLDAKVFPYLEAKGINLGVTIITISVLIPIANGAIGFKELGDAIKSPYAWIALASGIAVALIAKMGLHCCRMIRTLPRLLYLGRFLRSPYSKVWLSAH